MAIFPGGKSTRINSPRHLTIRHSRRVVAAYRREARRLARASTLAADDDSGDEIDPLPPGQQQLNSFWVPGLEAGPVHRINVKQTITAPTNDPPLVLEAEQDFSVDAPQFTLPDGSVHSTYPPAGYSDDHRILPHIVLTDPHLPWERLGTLKHGTNQELRMKMKMIAAGKTEDKPARNRVPWLVMFSFSQDELRLPNEDLTGPQNIFRNTTAGVIKPVKQSSTMTVNMSIEDLWNLTADVTTPVTQDPGSPSIKEKRGDFIFVQPELFTSLFSTFDEDGKQIVGSNPDTTQYQYLSHVRKINGSGMALAGVEDTAVFSIVVGNRSGPLDNTAPTTMCAHLVSIEGVEAMKFPDRDQGQRYVALCSLYSWNYTVLPPNTLNVPDAFEHLGRTLDVLRAPEATVAPLRDAGDKVKKLVSRRLDDGYTLVKYRTQTGEATVALYRGPLTPSNVPPLDNLPGCSNSGVDLQVLDKELGIMDVSYSVAWQVGRTLALGDQASTAALCRLRSSIHSTATAATKLQTVKDVDDAAFRTREDVLEGLKGMAKSLAAMHLSRRDSPLPEIPGPDRPVFAPGGPKRRWFRSRLDRADMPDLSFASPSIQARYPAAAAKAARSLANSTSQGLYDETNDPQSTDWMIVLSWLVDRMFLAGVPAHCLIPDPTYLEPESLRFFLIDRNWVDALLDGALSLGNHFGDDTDRVAIKEALNDYINHTPEGQDHPVQIPAYGFYLRSDLVTMFPDLRVEVLANEDALRSAGEDPPKGAPLLRHEIVTDGVMMAFTDRMPGSVQFGRLVLTQPAHQQRFAVARDLNPKEVIVDIRRQYTVDQATREKDIYRHDILKKITCNSSGDGSSDNIFIWDSQPGQGHNDLRILRLPRFAEVQLRILQENMPKYNDGDVEKPFFEDDAATSALFAMQLNDPIYNLTVDLQAHPPPGSSVGGLKAPSSKSAAHEIRTLRLLRTARVKRLTPNDQRSLGRDTSTQTGAKTADVDDGIDEATFQRHKNYTPSTLALSNHLGPQVRALPSSISADLGAPPILHPSAVPGTDPGNGSDDQLTGSEPAMSPKYFIRIGSNIINDWGVITLGKPNLPQDIIFSVVLQQSEVSQYLLMELAIDIELGAAPSSESDAKVYLMQNYTGPGAHMLTNLRFNVLPTMAVDPNNDKQNTLRLRLLPRASKRWVKATAVRELSFLLGLASINAPKQHTQKIRVRSWADYCRNPNQPLEEKNTLRITNPDTVVTVVNPDFPS